MLRSFKSETTARRALFVDTLRRAASCPRLVAVRMPWDSRSLSEVNELQRWVLEVLHNRLHERGPDVAVDHPMVERAR